MDNRRLTQIIIGLVLFIVSTSGAYYLFQNSPTIKNATQTVTVPKQTNDLQALSFNNTQPKTQPCPLNGVLYSKDQEAWWQQHRPLGVMIENHSDARPQSGISYADVTYEAVAEGGITRTLNVFYCQDSGIVGPVRSARTYFIDYISEYGDSPLYAHVGGANTPGPADAIGQLSDYGWTGYNDLNQFAIGFPTYWRDETRQGHPVATEHTMYSTTSKLWQVAKDRVLTNVDKNGNQWDTNFVQYTFKDDAAVSDRPASQTIHIDFWQDPNYAVDWIYDPKTNLYVRKNGGVPHIDRDTNKQLSAKDVIVLYEVESHADDGYTDNEHLLYGDKGSGNADIFMDGKVVHGTWRKTSRTARTVLYNESGAEVKFDRGHMWFEIIPTYSNIIIK